MTSKMKPQLLLFIDSQSRAPVKTMKISSKRVSMFLLKTNLRGKQTHQCVYWSLLTGVFELSLFCLCFRSNSCTCHLMLGWRRCPCTAVGCTAGPAPTAVWHGTPTVRGTERAALLSPLRPKGEAGGLTSLYPALIAGYPERFCRPY